MMNYELPGASTGATGMELDQDPQGQETPQSTSFEDGFTPSTTRGNTTTYPIGGVNTEKLLTPLYTESQEIDHTNVNTNLQTPAPIRTRLEAIRHEELAVAAAAAAAEAEASAATADAEMEASAEMEAQAAATAAAETTTHLALEAAATAET